MIHTSLWLNMFKNIIEVSNYKFLPPISGMSLASQLKPDPRYCCLLEYVITKQHITIIGNDRQIKDASSVNEELK